MLPRLMLAAVPESTESIRLLAQCAGVPAGSSLLETLETVDLTQRGVSSANGRGCAFSILNAEPFLAHITEHVLLKRTVYTALACAVGAVPHSSQVGASTSASATRVHHRRSADGGGGGRSANHRVRVEPCCLLAISGRPAKASEDDVGGRTVLLENPLQRVHRLYRDRLVSLEGMRAFVRTEMKLAPPGAGPGPSMLGPGSSSATALASSSRVTGTAPAAGLSAPSHSADPPASAAGDQSFLLATVLLATDAYRDFHRRCASRGGGKPLHLLRVRQPGDPDMGRVADTLPGLLTFTFQGRPTNSAVYAFPGALLVDLEPQTFAVDGGQGLFTGTDAAAGAQTLVPATGGCAVSVFDVAKSVSQLPAPPAAAARGAGAGAGGSTAPHPPPDTSRGAKHSRERLPDDAVALVAFHRVIMSPLPPPDAAPELQGQWLRPDIPAALRTQAHGALPFQCANVDGSSRYEEGLTAGDAAERPLLPSLPPLLVAALEGSLTLGQLREHAEAVEEAAAEGEAEAAAETAAAAGAGAAEEAAGAGRAGRRVAHAGGAAAAAAALAGAGSSSAAAGSSAGGPDALLRDASVAADADRSDGSIAGGGGGAVDLAADLRQPTDAGAKAGTSAEARRTAAAHDALPAPGGIAQRPASTLAAADSAPTRDTAAAADTAAAVVAGAEAERAAARGLPPAPALSRSSSDDVIVVSDSGEDGASPRRSAVAGAGARAASGAGSRAGRSGAGGQESGAGRAARGALGAAGAGRAGGASRGRGLGHGSDSRRRSGSDSDNADFVDHESDRDSILSDARALGEEEGGYSGGSSGDEDYRSSSADEEEPERETDEEEEEGEESDLGTHGRQASWPRVERGVAAAASAAITVGSKRSFKQRGGTGEPRRSGGAGGAPASKRRRVEDGGAGAVAGASAQGSDGRTGRGADMRGSSSGVGRGVGSAVAVRTEAEARLIELKAAGRTLAAASSGATRPGDRRPQVDVRSTERLGAGTSGSGLLSAASSASRAGGQASADQATGARGSGLASIPKKRAGAADAGVGRGTGGGAGGGVGAGAGAATVASIPRRHEPGTASVGSAGLSAGGVAGGVAGSSSRMPGSAPPAGLLASAAPRPTAASRLPVVSSSAIGAAGAAAAAADPRRLRAGPTASLLQMVEDLPVPAADGQSPGEPSGGLRAGAASNGAAPVGFSVGAGQRSRAPGWQAGVSAAQQRFVYQPYGQASAFPRDPGATLLLRTDAEEEDVVVGGELGVGRAQSNNGRGFDLGDVAGGSRGSDAAAAVGSHRAPVMERSGYHGDGGASSRQPAAWKVPAELASDRRGSHGDAGRLAAAASAAGLATTAGLRSEAAARQHSDAQQSGRVAGSSGGAFAVQPPDASAAAGAGAASGEAARGALARANVSTALPSRARSRAHPGGSPDTSDESDAGEAAFNGFFGGQDAADAAADYDDTSGLYIEESVASTRQPHAGTARVVAGRTSSQEAPAASLRSQEYSPPTGADALGSARSQRQRSTPSAADASGSSGGGGFTYDYGFQASGESQDQEQQALYDAGLGTGVWGLLSPGDAGALRHSAAAARAAAASAAAAADLQGLLPADTAGSQGVAAAADVQMYVHGASSAAADGASAAGSADPVAAGADSASGAAEPAGGHGRDSLAHGSGLYHAAAAGDSNRSRAAARHGAAAAVDAPASRGAAATHDARQAPGPGYRSYEPSHRYRPIGYSSADSRRHREQDDSAPELEPEGEGEGAAGGHSRHLGRHGDVSRGRSSHSSDVVAASRGGRLPAAAAGERSGRPESDEGTRAAASAGEGRGRGGSTQHRLPGSVSLRDRDRRPGSPSPSPARSHSRSRSRSRERHGFRGGHDTGRGRGVGYGRADYERRSYERQQRPRRDEDQTGFDAAHHRRRERDRESSDDDGDNGRDGDGGLCIDNGRDVDRGTDRGTGRGGGMDRDRGSGRSDGRGEARGSGREFRHDDGGGGRAAHGERRIAGSRDERRPETAEQRYRGRDSEAGSGRNRDNAPASGLSRGGAMAAGHSRGVSRHDERGASHSIPRGEPHVEHGDSRSGRGEPIVERADRGGRGDEAGSRHVSQPPTRDGASVSSALTSKSAARSGVTVKDCPIVVWDQHGRQGAWGTGSVSANATDATLDL